MFVFDILVYVSFAWLMYAYAKNSYVFAKRTGRFEQPDRTFGFFGYSLLLYAAFDGMWE